jgi:hypothetical protein
MPFSTVMVAGVTTVCEGNELEESMHLAPAAPGVWMAMVWLVPRVIVAQPADKMTKSKAASRNMPASHKNAGRAFYESIKATRYWD